MPSCSGPRVEGRPPRRSLFGPSIPHRAKTRRFASGCLAVLLALAAGPAVAQWHVAPGGNDAGSGTAAAPFATIQHALDVALGGDEVLLADGDYSGAGNRQLDFRGKGVTVRSLSGRREDCRVLAAGLDGFVFVSNETNAALVADLSIVGASRGVLVKRSYPRIVNCLIESCAIGLDVSGVGGRIAMERCLVRGGGTGARFHHDARGGAVTATSFRDHSGPGVATADLWTLSGGQNLRLIACELADNDGDGLSHQAPNGRVELIDCEASANGGWGLMSISPFDGGVSVTGGAVYDNIAGGINTINSQWDFIAGCKVYGNGGPGIATSRDSYHGVSDCLIRDNTGDGITFGSETASQLKRWQPVAVTNCVIYGNGGCGINFARGPHHDNLVTGTLIYRNAGPGIRVTTPANPQEGTRILVRESTLTGNGAGLELGSAVKVEIERTLIAFNLGAAVDCLVTPDVALSCSDLYGNTGGDWTGPIAGQVGTAGNLTVDPYFCDSAADDYHLLDLSPCAPKNRGDDDDCGRIGALDIGGSAAPRLTALADVPGDQGGSLRLTWAASPLDRPDVAQPVTGYGIYRRQEVKAGHAAAPSGDKLLGWDYLATVPSRGDDGYQFVVPTLVNASADDSTGCWSVFMISAMTASPFLFADSAPDSGLSLDNLAPAMPGGLRLEIGRRLAWDACHEADFADYSVYGSTTGLLDDDAVLVGRTTGTTLDVTNAVHRWFLVTANDRHGNRSTVATWAAAAATGRHATTALALDPCQPNPFNPSTTIRLEMPAPGPARLEVFDLAGRHVRTLLASDLVGGPHAVVWDGRDDEGRRAGAGIYLARLEAAGQWRTTRMTLVK